MSTEYTSGNVYLKGSSGSYVSLTITISSVASRYITYVPVFKFSVPDPGKFDWDTNPTFSYSISCYPTGDASSITTLKTGSLTSTADWSTASTLVFTFGNTSGTITSADYVSTGVTFYAELEIDGTYNGTYISTVGATVSVPAEDIFVYTTPSAPTSFTVTRSSDTAQKLAWTGNNTDTTDTGYWSKIAIRRKTDDGSYSVIATLSNTATSYTDTSTSAGHKYQYKVCPSNGSILYTGLSYITIYTTPATPSSISVESGNSARTVTVVPGSSYTGSIQVGVSTDSGSSWTLLGTATSSDSAYIYTDSNIYTDDTIYRTRAAKTSGGSSSSTLYSAWLESSTIAAEYTAPGAPSVAALNSYYETGSTVKISWTPNHSDNTAQTAAQVSVTNPDGDTTVYDVSGSTTYYNLTLGTDGTYTIRVRTLGLYEDYGDWSTAVVIIAAAAPVVAFVAPEEGMIVGSFPLEIEWTAEDDTGISSQTLTLEDTDSNTLYTFNIDTSDRATELDLSNYVSTNNTDYVLVLLVYNGLGLSTTATVSYSLSYGEPLEPSVDITYNDDLAAELNVTYMNNWYVDGTELVSPTGNTEDDEDEENINIIVDYGFASLDEDGVAEITEGVPCTSATVYRVNEDGSTTLISYTSADEGGTALDRLPPLNLDYSYLVTAYSELGTYSTIEVSAYCDSNGQEAFNFDSGATTAVIFGLDGSGSESISMDGELYHFATGEDEDALPEFYATGDLDNSISRSYVIADEDLYRNLRKIIRKSSNATPWFRDYWGHRMKTYSTWQLSRSANSPDTATVTASINEVIWSEPNNE